MERSILLYSFWALFALSLVTFCQSSEDVADDCFRAAVYEHDRVGDEDPINNIGKNLEIYRNVVEKAAKEGAVIVVLPEDGLFFPPTDRAAVTPFLEEIPNLSGQEVVNPCNAGNGSSNFSIVCALSCLSKDNNIYLTACIGDIQPCNGTESNDCPPDGHYQYNTQVVFDNLGNLVAKYHKQHLFKEPYYDLPPKQELVAVNTSFGTLGLWICFDTIFKDPGVTLTQDLGVDTMLLSTWWFDEAPFLMAHQYQQGWSFTNRVNLLASNIKRLEKGSTGSGIYSGRKGALIYEHDIVGNFPKVLVATLPKFSRNGTECAPKPVVIPIEYEKYNKSYKTLKDTPQEVFKQLRLDSTQGVVSLCDNGFCCSLNYSLDSKALHEVYFLSVANRTGDGGYLHITPWCEEMCALLAYNELNKTYAQTASTSFEYIHLKANFTTQHVYPSVLLNNYDLAPIFDWSLTENDLEVELVVKNDQPVIVSGLYGRCYDRDPPYSRGTRSLGHNSAQCRLFSHSYLFCMIVMAIVYYLS